MRRQALNRAMTYLLLRHLFRKDSDNQDTDSHHDDESDLIQTFQVKAKNLRKFMKYDDSFSIGSNICFP